MNRVSKHSLWILLTALVLMISACGASRALAGPPLGTGGPQPPVLSKPPDPTGGGSNSSGDPDEWEINQRSASKFQAPVGTLAGKGQRSASVYAVETCLSTKVWLVVLWQMRFLGL